MPNKGFILAAHPKAQPLQKIKQIGTLLSDTSYQDELAHRSDRAAMKDMIGQQADRWNGPKRPIRPGLAEGATFHTAEPYQLACHSNPASSKA
jgi:hypothetical protein